MAKTSIISQLNDSLSYEVRRTKGHFIARAGYYYRSQAPTEEKMQEVIKSKFPDVVIIKSGDVWKTFKGGGTTAQNSHIYVEFKLEKI